LYMMVLLVTDPYLRSDDDKLHQLVQVNLMLIMFIGIIIVRDPHYDEATDLVLSFILIALTVLLFILFIQLSVINVVGFVADLVKTYVQRKRGNIKDEVAEARARKEKELTDALQHGSLGAAL